jgi:hypothetical protein
LLEERHDVLRRLKSKWVRASRWGENKKQGPCEWVKRRLRDRSVEKVVRMWGVERRRNFGRELGRRRYLCPAIWCLPFWEEHHRAFLNENFVYRVILSASVTQPRPKIKIDSMLAVHMERDMVHYQICLEPANCIRLRASFCSP